MSPRDMVGQRWPYDSPSRRRGRAIRRLADATVRSGSLQPCVLPTYWWDAHPNFGDALTPWILGRYGIAAVHTPPQDARAAGVGSIIELLGEDFAGTIWGSGLLHGEPVPLPNAAVLAVRGPETKSALGITEDIALGDPGILIAGMTPRTAPRWRLGVIPHALHRHDQSLREFALSGGSDATIIDVLRRPGQVVDHIAQCGAILTTSLHGLIVADALRIPVVWTQRHPALWGGDFKFRDYEGLMTPGRTREVVITSDTRVGDVLAGVDVADADARYESIRRLEETVWQLPVTREPAWQELLRRARVARRSEGS